MKMKLLLWSLMLCIFGKTTAQDQKLEKAGKLYDQFTYIDAMKTYQNVAEKGHVSTELLQKFGDAYY